MNREPQRLVDYLSHILEAVERIATYTEDMDEAAFLNDRMVQDAVLRNLEVIGEASNNIEWWFPEFAEAHPELLTFAHQMRNAVAYGYYKVDYEIVWRTIQRNLPGLSEEVVNLLRDLET